ncbi:MAG: hypothetical protein JNJ90_17760 [Saprospiraceae bacterium]|jgi:hypothetical protein|nr:hypothetical protein [Saprospiraceae bacterium]
METNTRSVARRRYPGAVPFETEQQDIFFGRSRAREELYNKITLERLVVLYGKSGDGKSSLINAGIVPKALEEANKDSAGQDDPDDILRFEPIKIRFGAYRSEKTSETPVEKAFHQILNTPPPVTKDDIGVLADEVSLWRAVRTRSQRSAKSSKFNSILLIFDQFEEIFTYPPEQYDQFGQQLAEALHVLLPMRYVHEMKRTGTQIPELRKPIHIHILIGIRSDRIHLLNLLQRHLPNIQKNNYVLPPLNEEEAEDAILFPALKAGDFDAPSFDFENAALRRITNFLTKNDTQPVASFQLQILCESLEKKILATPGVQRISEADVGDPETLYEGYYRDRIAELGDKQDRDAARRLIEDGLIYEEEDRRLSLYEGQIRRDYGVGDALLNRLVDARLLRAEPSLQGGYTYELSHDTLVRPVARMKAVRKNAENRRRERKQRLRLAGAMALAVLGFGLAGITWWQYQAAEKARDEAFSLREEAVEARNDLEKLVDHLNYTIDQLNQMETDELLGLVESAVGAKRYDYALSILQDANKAQKNPDPRIQKKIEEIEKLKQ